MANRTRRTAYISDDIRELCRVNITVRNIMERFVLGEYDYATALEKCTLALSRNNDDLLKRLDMSHADLMRQELERRINI